MKFDTLYALASNGKVKVWIIEADEDDLDRFDSIVEKMDE